VQIFGGVNDDFWGKCKDFFWRGDAGIFWGTIPKTLLRICCHILEFEKVLNKFQYNFPNSGGGHPNL
jgi:hypothetical protein